MNLVRARDDRLELLERDEVILVRVDHVEQLAPPPDLPRVLRVRHGLTPLPARRRARIRASSARAPGLARSLIRTLVLFLRRCGWIVLALVAPPLILRTQFTQECKVLQPVPVVLYRVQRVLPLNGRDRLWPRGGEWEVMQIARRAGGETRGRRRRLRSLPPPLLPLDLMDAIPRVRWDINAPVAVVGGGERSVKDGCVDRAVERRVARPDRYEVDRLVELSLFEGLLDKHVNG
mmetsp:Transcript_39466/g.90867  ORF Transcript_39466/g.90867 Transcript_39466/m.90867 type:complete len:234 (+) Transcript_39466:1487-2188(+)